MVIQHDLQEILAGFSHLEFEKEGLEARYLRFHFQWEGMKKSVPFYLSQLSEGQRMLVALYSLLHIPESDQDNLGFSVSEYALFLDEPDNFISLREIQPWLVRLQDKVFDGAVQASIISHHPEVIDYLLVPNNGAIQTFYFERPSGTVTTIKEFPHSPENILKPSELIARNWI
jgi:ATPase subunit of ABC transporter with duplicated ATPase domains